ncbi:acetoacetate--CoA ligase [Planomonospora parontospora]|uniref:acetoacetate--CoA ligase n=1 Tax=Planomonospora parontospora TaxID=58119 RepID=UPI001670A586|nr:acetoacetate--CoA ligase [Planomonospora parontospora]GGL08742.1 acetoacetyl-CoA synthetase [Planomonospora parontospora subsp. antibiotica]GII14495.1 acetoacetyl-CoA synthetase [Planomonospora parontospora subsp. antibiotica]
MVKEGALLWEPTPDVTKNAKVTAYMEWLGRPVDYQALWRWSVEAPEEFWTSVWDYFGVVGERGDGPVISGTMPGAEWFTGSALNYAENALRRAQAEPDRLAVVFRDESGGRRTLTLGELAGEVARVRTGLAALGVGRGDRVAAYAPNVPETLVAFLATASLGAIWSSCSPDFGAPSVIDRFTQIEPKVLLAADGYDYNGRHFDRSGVAGDIAARLPTLAALVRLPAPGAGRTADAGTAATEEAGRTAGAGDATGTAGAAGGAAGGGGAPDGPATVLTWEELRSADGPLAFERVPFGHPLWIVYSSGTTGLPKPIVHGHGGVVLEHLKALSFHQDLGPDDVFFWYTTTGWMMWNYLVGGLLVGSAVLLYDGSATHPETGALWRLAAEEGVTYFGTGAPYITASMKAGLEPGGLERLRGLGSTGSPLPPEGFAWVHDTLPEVQLGSFSGGTDVCTGFVGAVPLLPVRAGVIPCRCLGAKVESFDPSGKPVVGEVGELVLTVPMPSMPVMFWNDPDGSRYRESYFDDYPGVWRHGDWIKILPDGGCVIYGRSDSTLNRGGVRMGTSEFYRVVERFEEIADSLVIDTGQLGQEGRLLLYVTMAEGAELTGDLVARLRTALRTELSPRHVPDEITEVPGIPRTLSGKKLEVPIRKILLGVPPEQAANLDAMANPEVLFAFTPES